MRVLWMGRSRSVVLFDLRFTLLGNYLVVLQQIPQFLNLEPIQSLKINFHINLRQFSLNPFLLFRQFPLRHGLNLDDHIVTHHAKAETFETACHTGDYPSDKEDPGEEVISKGAQFPQKRNHQADNNEGAKHIERQFGKLKVASVLILAPVIDEPSGAGLGIAVGEKGVDVIDGFAGGGAVGVHGRVLLGGWERSVGVEFGPLVHVGVCVVCVTD